MSVSKAVTLYIQEHSGNYNYDQEFDTKELALSFLEIVKEDGGYWVADVFVPWHRVDYAEVQE